MESTAHRAIAIVGVGAVLPDAPNVSTFWENVKQGRDSVTEVTPDRWDPALYYDPDPKAPDKTYSKIGGWVRQHTWDPMKWHLPIPPRVAAAMDDAQKWAISCTRAALEDYGYPKRPLDTERTAVILGSAIAGEKQYFTVLRLYFPEYEQELANTSSFAALPPSLRADLNRQLHERINQRFPEVTEDTMPGELANCIAGRIANLYNFRGPNYVCDAACASAMAAISSAVEGLVEKDFDVAVTGGIDRNMGPSTYIKFCKIGALSATGSRPYAQGADGFVMGEGAAIFLLKRLADAERDGDTIYAVLRGMGGSSDGKGKGITAPNPIGQKICMKRAWENAGLSPGTVTMIEGHGTSTSVGDAVELQSMVDVLQEFHLPTASVALGSVKSNFGHLKGAAGAAGLLKAALAIRHKVIPPSIHCHRTNPGVDFAHSPLYVNTELKPWDVPKDVVRRAGVSAFGFGGTNFHIVLEEHIPGKLNGNGKRSIAVGDLSPAAEKGGAMTAKSDSRASYDASSCKPPLRGALVIGGESEAAVIERLRAVHEAAKAGSAPPPSAPAESDLRAPERIAIDYADAAELAEKSSNALKAFPANNPAIWKMLRAQGVFRGHGPACKVAFLYPGQGSQYANMLCKLRDSEPVVARTFAEADRVMTPLLGKPLSEFIFINADDPAAVAQAEEALRQTAITQPAVLATDQAITGLLSQYGIEPDMTMGHSLGEYGALVAAGAMPFGDALEAVSARGREMTRVSFKDNGRMAAVFAPLAEIERILKTINGYIVIANINSEHQSVIGGASRAVEQAMEALQKAGYEVSALNVSHAFHTSIVAPASGPLRQVLERLRLQAPAVPVVANVNGEFYPMGADVVPQMLDILAKQVAAPVQFIKGLRTLYDAGARVFVETGPKKALQGLVDDMFGDRTDVVSVFTNHPKVGEIVSFNQALCGLYAAGLGRGRAEAAIEVSSRPAVAASAAPIPADTPKPAPVAASTASTPAKTAPLNGDRYVELGRMFADVLERGWQMYHGERSAPQAPVVITGAALGLPGTEHIFDDANVGRILRGEQFIDAIPTRLRRAMLDKNITRLVKSDNGGPVFESIHDLDEVIKLAGRGGKFDLESEFGVPAERIPALDSVTQLAIASGIDALRDAGIPIVLRYKKTSKGTFLPDRWGLPDALRDDTGVIFASAFPGCDSYADEMSRYYADHARREQVSLLEDLSARIALNGDATLRQEIQRRISELRAAIEKEPYVFDRRFLFRVLSMGHSQFAEYIGARGPNTQVNSACASTTQAVALAEDWINAGRCRRVIIVSSDNVTSDHTMEWFGAGFLATGAAATDEVVEDAAIPFDRRRHGMIVGMGAAALVVESAEAARERGLQPICEVLSAVTANSAFHGTRLDVNHIGDVMEKLVAQAEARSGIARRQVADKTVFVSHETYTPARGGSASAEIYALRRVFGDAADRIVIANTKGFTGHAMATGIEDVVAIKALETGCVPPVANFRDVDPELGVLNLSKGGIYPVEYAIRLGAGFGSQISLTFLRWVKSADGVRRNADSLGYAYRIVDKAAWDGWLSRVTGQSGAELEVVKRTLRVRDRGVRLQVEAAQKDTISTKREISTNVPRGTIVDSSGTSAKPGTSVAAPVAVAAPVSAAAPVAVAPTPVVLKAVAPITVAKAKPVFAPAPAKVAVSSTTSIVKQPAVPKPAPVTPPQPADGKESVKERVLALVVEKTGYPREMLDLDLDLEADLGVDTVKQAELFAAIRGLYDIPRDENLKLRDFPTLAHVIRFVHERRPDLAAEVVQPAPVQAAAPAMPLAPKFEAPKPAQEAVTATPAPPVAERPAPPVAEAPASPPIAEAAAESIQDRVLNIVAEKTGYPKEMLDLDLDLEADLGIDTVKQAEMFAAIRTAYNIPRDENLKLRDFPTLAHVIRFARERQPGKPATAQVPPQPAVPSTAAAAQVSAQPPAPASAASAVAAPPELAAAMSAAEADSAQGSPADDGVASAGVEDKVLDIVAAKTGYPKEMLDLDLDLEADLGIDTVKQAEMFAAIRAAYNIPRDENLKLRDFPTLAHVIRFARERRPGQAAAPATRESTEPDVTHKKPPGSVSAASTASTASQRARPPLAPLDAANRIPRRVPVPVVRPPLAICRPTAVSLGQGSRVIVMPDGGGVGDSLAQQLRELDVEVLRIENASTADTLITLLKTWMAEGPIHGVYWLPALDQERSLGDLDLAAWHEAIRVRVKLLYAAMRTLYEQIAPAGTFLVSATRLGGMHGYDCGGAVVPLGGAVAGFTKTYQRERTEALVKVVDFEAERNPSEIAKLLIAETRRDPGAVEIGYTADQRWTVGLQEQPAADGQAGLTLNPDTVFLVTGAAGSIVSAITADLAAASGGTFYLLDIVPEPDAANPDLKRFVSDKDGLKRDLFARIQARGERATPALVERELAGLERAQAALSAIEAVRAAGGTAHYFSVNLAKADAVANAIEQVRRRSGRVDVLLHAAGLERSHFLPDKEPAEFDLVFDVKSDGWFNLLHAIGDMPLGATVAFSSIAGRFGNAGQADYSAANDLLCKMTSSFRSTRPATRGIVIDWTAWGGIGMATRGSIPKMMELAGIDMLPPEAGIPLIRRELTTGGTRGEIVIGQRFGVLLGESDPSGGVDSAAFAASSTEKGPMTGKLAGFGVHSGLTIETTIDPAVQPFLRDHQIDGTPVLPGVMGIEAFAEAALATLPGWHVEAIEDVNFLAPFKFYRNEPRIVTVHAILRADREAIVAECRLTGSRRLPNQAEPQVTTHFTGRVRLVRQAPKAVSGPALGSLTGSVFEAAEIYRVFFHGPAYQVVERAWRNDKSIVGAMSRTLPPNHRPPERPLAVAPRLIELCFQTAGVWEIAVNGRFGLPQHVDRVSVWRAPEADSELYAMAAPAADGSFNVEVVDKAGNRYVQLSGYHTIALPGAVEGEPLKAMAAAD